MGNKVRTILLLAVFAAPLQADTVHRLQPGETLYSLHRKYDVEVSALLNANGISDPSSLSVGMELIIPGESATIPASPSSGEYTVQPGDTYYSIARSHDMVVDELLSMNARDSKRILRVGETLLVRGSETPNPTSPSDPVPRPTPTTVSSGSVEVNDVPWWPVAGIKAPLQGKLVGVSIQAAPRSYIHAVADGNVVWTGPYRGFGHVVLVDSDGYIYLYGGNEDLFVNVGQSVATGNRLGRLGPSGPDGDSQEMIFSVFREGVPVSPDDAPRG